MFSHRCISAESGTVVKTHNIAISITTCRAGKMAIATAIRVCRIIAPELHLVAYMSQNNIVTTGIGSPLSPYMINTSAEFNRVRCNSCVDIKFHFRTSLFCLKGQWGTCCNCLNCHRTGSFLIVGRVIGTISGYARYCGNTSSFSHDISARINGSYRLVVRLPHDSLVCSII